MVAQTEVATINKPQMKGSLIMSLLELNRIIDDAASNSNIWIELLEWPQEVLQRYTLSEDELEALRTGNLERLREFGLDDYHLGKVRDLVAY
ncbi:MAG: hypothetical protein HYY30_01990 [Chloroflexi bacterium]|nr:hypothetical protein [Chloroflexota bacterium]